MGGFGVTVLICTLASPETCITRELSFAENLPLTPYVCMAAQVEIARLMEGYPDRYVKRWTCHKTGEEQDI